MKGQSLNIDWMVGFLLIMVSIISSTVLVIQDNPQGVTQVELKSKAEELTDGLVAETEIEARKNFLHIRGPQESGKIPVDTSYIFTNSSHSPVMDIPAKINVSANSVVSSVEAENKTYELTFFFEEYGDQSYENEIQTGKWMNNSDISVKPGGNGLDSLRLNGFEFLNNSADLAASDTSVSDKELYASTASGRLKIYNQSQEMILENTDGSFNLKNFTTLYWEADNSTTVLAGTGSFKSGSTQGLTVAGRSGTDYGITFSGDMDATVSKPNPSTISVDVDSSRTRIYLHQSDYVEGWKRINYHKNSKIFFGAEKTTNGASTKKIENLNNPSTIGFENRFDITDYGYNISYKNLTRGGSIPFSNVVASTRKIPLIGKKGNFSKTDLRVALWE